MADQMSLDGILSDEEPKTPAPSNAEPVITGATPAPEVEVERVKSRQKEHLAKEWAAQGRDPETGQFISKEPEKKEVAAADPEKAKDPPKVELTEKEKALLARANDETRKRQELERRLAAIEQERAKVAQTQQPVADSQQPKTFWEDADGALQQQKTEMLELKQEFKNELMQTKLQISEDFARSRHPDYAETIPIFGELLKTTPGLYQQWAASPDMAEFAYKIAKNHQQLQQADGLDNLLKKKEEEITAKVRKEIEEELAKKEAEKQKLAESLPRSLSEMRGTSQQTPAWGGPTPLSSILKH